MRKNHWFSSAVGLGLLLLSVACGTSGPKAPTPCTDIAGCATGQYCAAGTCTAKIAAGAPCTPGTGHTANDLCTSGVCAGGNCCTAACASTDPACASTACAATGACLYPDGGTVCGTAAACTGSNFLPASHCNGAGGCTAAASVSCSPYICFAGACATSCRASADCDTGFYCANGVCITKEDAGATCNSSSTSAPNEACLSGSCLAKHCCADACSIADPICHANACDVAGTCLYPDAGTGCGPLESCIAGLHTPASGCGGDGGCVISTPVQCGVYTCDSRGIACYTSCTVGDDSRCTTGNYCATGGCTPQLVPGIPCPADNACISGICRANCCSGACGLDTSTNCLGSCDFDGGCSHHSCTPGYGCSGGQNCNTTCSSDADCAPDAGYSCSNPVNGSCCTTVAPGATIYVDGKLGADTNCCDSPSTACLTITHAMKLVNAAVAKGATISVAWNKTPAVQADWAPATPETYPIHLGWGVTLKAPGIFFTPPAPVPPKTGVDVFDVFQFGGTDTGTVTIEGDPTVDFVYIGFDSALSNLTGAGIAVNCTSPTVPLILSNVWMNAQTEALNMGAGANVTLGPAPVIIGSGANTTKPFTGLSSPGNGIVCQGSATNRATLSDDPTGNSILQIDSQGSVKLSAGPAQFKVVDACDVSLTQQPTFGPSAPCPSPKVDGEGIEINGSSTVTMKGATIQCMWNHGIDVGELGASTAVVALDTTLIQYTGQTGLKVLNGSVGPVTNSTVFHCRFGTVLAFGATGSIDLSGGGNVVSCNTNAEPGAFNNGNPPTGPGINVWNTSTNLDINAANLLWEAAPPGLWECTDNPQFNTASNCTCVSGTCSGTNVMATDQADAVYTTSNTDASPINQSDAGLQNKFGACN